MFKFIVLAVIFGVCSARHYDHHSSDYGDHSIELPVYSKADREVIHTPSHREEHSTHVEVDSGVLPVYMVFKTQSSPVYVKQSHRGTKGSHQNSHSKDEPHILVHEVVKPVIQELKEIIEPYRKVVQIIKPVHEEVLTKVHKDEGHSNGYGDNGGDSYGYKSGGDSHGYHSDDHDEYSSYGSSDDHDNKGYGMLGHSYGYGN